MRLIIFEQVDIDVLTSFQFDHTHVRTHLLPSDRQWIFDGGGW